MISPSSSATLETQGAVLNSLTLSDNDSDPAPEAGRDWAHQPAGFPRIFRKENFTIRSRVGHVWVLGEAILCATKYIYLTVYFYLDYEGYCTHSDKFGNSWFV